MSIDDVINELETNNGTKDRVRAAMAAMYDGRGLEPKVANYEDLRCMLHGAQDSIGDDLIAMANELRTDPEKYSARQMSTIFGWFEVACWLEDMLCNPEKPCTIVTLDLPGLNEFYTDDPIDDDE